jgi:hypothetical protein
MALCVARRVQKSGANIGAWVCAGVPMFAEVRRVKYCSFENVLPGQYFQPGDLGGSWRQDNKESCHDWIAGVCPALARQVRGQTIEHCNLAACHLVDPALFCVCVCDMLWQFFVVFPVFCSRPTCPAGHTCPR